MAKIGRPTAYSPEIAERLCTEISCTTKSLRKILEGDDDFPCMQTILNWLNTNEEFLALYTLAKEMQADYLVDEMLTIATDRGGENNDGLGAGGDYMAFVGTNRIQRDRLILDTFKFIASKLKPKRYGDKLDLSTGGGKPLQPGGVDAEQFAQLLQIAAGNNEKQT